MVIAVRRRGEGGLLPNFFRLIGCGQIKTVYGVAGGDQAAAVAEWDKAHAKTPS
jgi:hypothetical protein